MDIISEGRLLSRVCCRSVLEDVSELLQGYPELYLVYDRNVEPLAQRLLFAVPAIRASSSITASEENKSMETVLQICRWLLERDASRKALLLALGGGITTDIAGFAACLYKRGIRFACLPTTLLAQTDAAIGGKTGVNFMGYKNMLGVIRQPEFTCLCPEALETLPERDFLSGAAELLKSFVIENRNGNYARALQAVRERRSEEDLIFEAAAVKARIVGRDPFEAGERRKLNLGHTFAHAIEHIARERGEDITHGEAVAAGIILAAQLSEKRHVAGQGLARRLAEDFSSCGLRVQSPYPLSALVEAMAKDKKSEDGAVHFILIEEIGKVIIQKIIPQEIQ